MPKCKINGQELEVNPGTTIIEAFMQTKDAIAHYCWHPGLSIAGVCRLCMVEIEGMPKLQIACNTEIKDGMVISNQSEKVKEAVRWGLDFHLINHPLDCPICDQAGECGLQDQYMAFGKYDPEMAERKVKKRKVVDLGPTVVLDTERCILCSRCVRFTEEVSKTHELGIFNRGDRSEVGTFKDKPLANKYSLNTVDICPVGALTSKDFRFRQRVWYLKEADSICPGCSTGCNVKVYHNEEGLWRIRPRHNPEVNGYWMCDEGRDMYKFVNEKYRLLQAKVGHKGQWSQKAPGAAAKEVSQLLGKLVAEHGADSVALVLTGQYTSEEYEDMIRSFKEHLNSSLVYHWLNNPEQVEDFDGLLLRGDKNPNTQGLKQQLKKWAVDKNSWQDLVSRLEAGQLRGVVVAGPENQAGFPDIAEKVALLSKADHLIWLASNPHEAIDAVGTPCYQIPTKTYVEKEGTFVNYQGKAQSFKRVTTVVSQALTLSEVAQLLRGQELSLTGRPLYQEMKTNHFTALRGNL